MSNYLPKNATSPGSGVTEGGLEVADSVNLKKVQNTPTILIHQTNLYPDDPINNNVPSSSPTNLLINNSSSHNNKKSNTNHSSKINSNANVNNNSLSTTNTTSTLPLPNTGSLNNFSLTNSSLSSTLSTSSSSSSSTNNLNQNHSPSVTNQCIISTNSSSSMLSNQSPSPMPSLTEAAATLATTGSNSSSANSVTNTSSDTITPLVNVTQISNYYNDHLTGNGHFFSKKSFHKPAYCHHCTEMLWGIIGQGFICEVCNFVSHEKCQKSVASPCSSIAHTLIKNPVQHCWSEPCHFKRKFCNICRKRLDEHIGVRCEICEYFVHIDCQMLAVNDCCETALYIPNRTLSNTTHMHHWREGNLPSNSKCIVCKKTCQTVECLAGMKCEWCGITAHSICRVRLMDECNFGNLRDIIVPPFAVSVPRIEMNKEAILGIQTRNKNSTDIVNHNLVELKSESNSDQSVSYSTTTPYHHQQSQQSQHASNNYSLEVNNSLPDNTSTSSSSHLSASPSFLTSSSLTSIQLTNTNITNANTNTNTSNNNNSSSNANSSSAQAAGQNCNLSAKKKDKLSASKQHTQHPQTVDEEEERIIIRVYDGNTSLRKRVFRTISISTSCSYVGILEVSLRTFHINDDPNNYYLSIPMDNYVNTSNNNKQINLASSGSSSEDYQLEEGVVDEACPIKSIRSSNGCNNSSNNNNKRLSILLRYKDNNECENIRIYPGIIKDTSSYQTVTINLKTTVLETIEKALEKFEINKTNEADKFSLIEVLLDHNVDERLLNTADCPLQLVRKLRKESLCNNRMVRFYLQQKEDPHGPSVALFVGNLPSSLSQIQYEKILMDTIKNNNELRWTKFDVIYYEYGSMVILYEDSVRAVKAHNTLKDMTYEGKQLMVLLLPTIQHQMILPNVSPLLVFVNVKSGGQQGAELITSFRHLLNPHQVFDLQNGGPLPGLYVFRNIEKYRILACGGDGTIGWVLSCLDNVSQDAKCQSPPMAIVPLGTGNDLARVLRWGAGYTGAEEPINLLRDVIEAEEIMLDRWTVVFHADENKELDDMKRQLSIAVNVSQANTNEDNTEIYVMNNYFGIGIEASVCLDFHTAREENPNKFSSRLQNKKKYVQLGIRKIMNKGNCKDFNKNVTLEVDGKRIDISPQIEGIIILNILSWGSGTNPWGPEKDEKFSKPTHYDGMLEVVGIRGVVHMGQIQGGLSSAIRLAQGGRIKIRMNTEVPVHVDGEPWLQSPCAITILKSALKATMLKKSKLKIKRRNTEPNINVLVNNPGNESVSTLDPDAESEPF